MRRLLAYLLDIDGTLLTSSSAHLRVLASTLSGWVGRPVSIEMAGERPILDGRDIAGYVDAQVIRAVLAERREGPPDAAEVAAVVAQYGARYAERVQAGESAGRVIPGVDAFLRRARASGIHLALTTGNAAAVARAKLEAVGLADSFAFEPDLGFGDWRADRAEVCAAALAGIVGQGVDPATCAMVGDTTADMRAARGLNLIAIGVGTGAASAGDLMAAGASRIVGSVADLQRTAVEGADS